MAFPYVTGAERRRLLYLSSVPALGVLPREVANTTDELVGYVGQLPSPYRDPLERGTTAIDLPAEPDFDAVLEHLETDDTSAVSSWNRFGDAIRGWRRRPPKES